MECRLWGWMEKTMSCQQTTLIFILLACVPRAYAHKKFIATATLFLIGVSNVVYTSTSNFINRKVRHITLSVFVLEQWKGAALALSNAHFHHVCFSQHQQSNSRKTFQLVSELFSIHLYNDNFLKKYTGVWKGAVSSSLLFYRKEWQCLFYLNVLWVFHEDKPGTRRLYDSQSEE